MSEDLEIDHNDEVVPREPTDEEKTAFVRAAALSTIIKGNVKPGDSDAALETALKSARAAIDAGNEMGLQSDKTFQAITELTTSPAKPNPVRAMINKTVGFVKGIFVRPK